MTLRSGREPGHFVRAVRRTMPSTSGMGRTTTGRMRRVRVWFGEHVVADYTAEAVAAARYGDAMARRFAGLRVTNEEADLSAPARPRSLPGERLWELVP